MRVRTTTWYVGGTDVRIRLVALLSGQATQIGNHLLTVAGVCTDLDLVFTQVVKGLACTRDQGRTLGDRRFLNRNELVVQCIDISFSWLGTFHVDPCLTDTWHRQQRCDVLTLLRTHRSTCFRQCDRHTVIFKQSAECLDWRQRTEVDRCACPVEDYGGNRTGVETLITKSHFLSSLDQYSSLMFARYVPFAISLL